ncbi:Cytochrome P450 [Sergentomyia squamirostris]
MFLARKNSYLLINPLRSFSVQPKAAVISNFDEEISEESWKNAKPYDSIPGPSKFGVISSFMPGGRFRGFSFPEIQTVLRKEHGIIYKIPGLFGRRDLVLLNDPKDFEVVFRTEGNFPMRRGFDTIEYFRKVHRKDKYKVTAGLLNEHGEAWWDLRHKVNPVMMKPQITKGYTAAVDEVSTDFVKKLHNLRDSNQETPGNLFYQMNIWALESIAYITMNMRLGLLVDKPDASVEKIMENLKSLFDYINQLDFQPSIWKLVKTPVFRKQMQVMDELHDTISKFIDQGVKNLKDRNPNSQTSDREMAVLEKLYDIDKDVALIMVLDSLQAGVDTTSVTAFTTLYHLAANPDKQKILRAELKKTFPDKNTPLTKENMANMPYLRACVKESMRLIPVIPGNLRTTGQNIVIKGYQIPKLTDIVMYNYGLHLDDSYFPDHKAFIPERWLRSATEKPELTNSFTYLPFGFGSRACIGKRFAELEVESLIVRMILNYELEWNHPPPKMEFTSINMPIGDLKLKMKDL